jgi:replicative DNA helicase
MALAMDTDTEKIETGEDIATLGKKIVKENVEKWRKLQDDAKFLGQVPLEGVTTGIKKLDLLTLGYKPGDLIILGAQTGHGKTAFALQTSMSVSVEAKQPMLYINTEMRREQIAYRWGSIISQLPMQQIRTGSLSNEQLHHVLNSFSILGKEFLTSYMPNLTPNKLQSLARKAKLQYNIQFLILDYVGRMEKRDPKYQEWQVLEDIVKSCKILAQNLEIAVMVLVQLNEDGTLQGAKRMKNECDVMLKLIPICENLNDEEELREAQGKYERKTKSQYEPFNYKLWIDKSRDSKAGLSIPLVFDMERQQIREAQEV